ncbi:DUF2852 domain-containing protein [Tabrizicola sp. M-4]|uniref:DUF2852 domain-containing protein n=1 Tax=Tabrizicola sp. M-4 TaxID=3055847 RepID=UPI003DA8318E
MNTFPAAAARPAGGLLSWPRRAEAWLDGHGRKAWITAMVLGFIFFWPVGLALVAYMTITNRWSKTMFGQSCRKSRNVQWGAHRVYASSGNTAFDAYKAETLRRLEEEQAAFEGFLNRLREAKDKQEFDAFMDDRARTAREAGSSDTPPAQA